MVSTSTLVQLADSYKLASNISRDTTVSNRVFSDTKKLGALRSGSDITLGRFNDAVAWFRTNWPEGSEFPEHLLVQKGDANV